MPSTRIAMWSGPRNISTALMRSWGNRPDTFVVDEPLYAHYLQTTGVDHPGRDEVIASQENDWRKVVDWLTGPIPDGKEVFYQKHMAHHLVPDISRDWLGRVSNAFLIRNPGEMLTSYLKVVPNPTLENTGLPQQVEMFRWVEERTGTIPPVIDAKDVLDNPRMTLAALCAALGVEFREEMLSWEPGTRNADGVWAKHWYSEIEKTTSFKPYIPKSDAVPERLLGLLAECQAHYDFLAAHRIRRSAVT
jgi:hypothetical protein